MIEYAIRYIRMGFSVIPVRPDKKPFIKWEPYQKHRATEEELKTWWTKWPNAMIGVVTGGISGVAVIDVDDPDKGMLALSEYLSSCMVPTAKTPRGGYHLYFKAPETPLSNNARLVPGCDFRGEGGYVIAPPSVGYNWLPGLSIEEVDPPTLPPAYISLINSFKHYI
jgi:hypothetical protein